MKRIAFSLLSASLALLGACSTQTATYCDADEQCPETGRCDVARNVCAEPPGGGSSCGEDAPCESGVCTPEGVCAGCAADAECPAESPVCGASGACESCESGTAGDAVCASRDAEAPVCSSAGSCVQCEESSHCPAGAPVCSDASSCRGCEMDTECATGLCEEGGACAAEDSLVLVDGAEGSDSDDCGTVAAPCATIGHALTLATLERERIVVRAGDYPEALTINNKKVQIIASGDVRMAPDLGGKKYAVDVTASSDVTLKGLSIEPLVQGSSVHGVHCNAFSGVASVHLLQTTISKFSGLGLDAVDCNVTVEESTLAANQGGGLTSSEGMVSIKQSTISKNQGGGVTMRDGAVAVQQSTISENRGVGVTSVDGAVTVERSTLWKNRAGGVSVTDSNFTIQNNVIAENGAPESPVGGVKLVGGSSTAPRILQFNTIAANQVRTFGGAEPTDVDCELTTFFVASNNIVYSGAAETATVDGNCSWTYSIIEGGAPGTGNLDIDPLFVDPAAGDYHLQPGSPAIDKASPTATLAIDIDGEMRPAGSAHDIGADEQQ